MEMRICDCRNAKYQGQTLEKQPHGFGFVLDDNYSLIATQWDNFNMIGPVMAIFGDSSKIYGDVLGMNDEIIVFGGRQCKIFKTKNRLVVDMFVSKMLLHISNEPNLNRSQTNHDKKQKLRIIDEKRYNKESYLGILQEFLQVSSLPNKYLSYQNFMKDSFKSKYRDLISICQNSKEFSFSFYCQGIFAKLKKQNDCLLTLGSTGADKKVQIMRKYSYFQSLNQATVQQSIETEPNSLAEFKISDTFCKSTKTILAAAKDLGFSISDIKSSSLQDNDQQKDGESNGRPKQCILNLREYYKRSLTFANRYLNLSKVYQTKAFFESLYLLVRSTGSGKYAQAQLQNHINDHEQIVKSVNVRHQQHTRHIEATVDDWKKQLDRTTISRDKSRRRISNKTNVQQTSSYFPSRITHNQLSPDKSSIKKAGENDSGQKSPNKRTGIKRRQNVVNYYPEQSNLTYSRNENIGTRQKEKKTKNMQNKVEMGNRYLHEMTANKYNESIGEMSINSKSKSPAIRFKYIDE